MENKLRYLLKQYGADDAEIENFIKDLSELKDDIGEKKLADVFDEISDDDFEV